MQHLFTNNNITIRKFKPEELPLFLELFDDPEVTKYLPFRSKEQYAEMFHIALEEYKANLLSRYGIFNAKTNAFIGMCLIRPFADIKGPLEIGYTLAKSHWAKGIATEVSRALTNYCFKNTTVDNVVAVTDLNNIGSQRVLENSGFTRRENLKRPTEELAFYAVERKTY